MLWVVPIPILNMNDFSRPNVTNYPVKSGCLQRRLNRAFGSHWLVLNHSFGFIDPLHSTGIAHTLSGIERILHGFRLFGLPSKNQKVWKSLFEKHESCLIKELTLIDTLVAGCYRCRKHPVLFNAYSMLYFACSIHYEQARLNGQNPESFLSADHKTLFNLTQDSWALVDEGKTPPSLVIEFIREGIAPFNIVGLMDESKRNMYAHTAVEL